MSICNSQCMENIGRRLDILKKIVSVQYNFFKKALQSSNTMLRAN